MLDGGYGIAPNVVTYDTELPDAAFRLFVIISSHCAERGYCWASNEYLGNLVGKHPRSIPRLLKSLEKYIEIKDGSNEHRKIWLRKNVMPGSQKREGGYHKNVKHNNTSEYYKKNRSSNRRIGENKPISVEKYLKTYHTQRPTPKELPPWVIDERKQFRDNQNNTR